MWKDSSYRLAVVFAIILHILLITAFFLHISARDSHPISLQPNVDIIKAVTISQDDLTKIAQLKAQQAKQQQEAAEAKAAAEQQRLKEQAEQKAQAALKEQQRQQQLLQAQHQRELKEQQLAAQKQAEQQAKQKAIQQQEELQQQQAQQAKQAALEKAQKEKLKKQQQQKQADQLKVAEQKALDSQLAAEQKAMTAARTKEQQTELQKYKALIQAAIQQNWVVPGSSNPDLTCELTIKLGPGGTVLSVQVTRSSGDSGLDNSARAAVYKASPLPVPTDADLASQFHELRLTASPKNIAEQ